MNPYTSTWSGVTPGDGPQEVHVVLLDNGRTRALADEVGRQALRCIRCSACLNSCPVYERVGGHAYGSVYPGPIGAILNPLLKGVGTDPQVDSLPYASTLCGACADVCPVAIDIPGILVHLRTKVVDAHRDDTVPKPEAVAMRAAAWGMADAGRMGVGERAAGLVGPVRSRPRDAGWSPRAVLAALARVALDAGPRPPAAACGVVPLLVAPGRPRRGAAMTARDDVLAAVRAALGPGRGAGVVRDDSASAVPSGSGAPAAPTSDRTAMLDLFADRVADYRATVTRCSAADLAETVTTALEGATSVVVPRGLELDIPGAIVDDGLTHAELDAVDAVVTRATVGIAETGTVVLDHGPGQGRRAITLLPDLHVCVVHESQVVPDVPDALPRLDPQRPQTWISGPSATSDIELSRVEGVHGPRRLHVVLVAD